MRLRSVTRCPRLRNPLHRRGSTARPLPLRSPRGISFAASLERVCLLALGCVILLGAASTVAAQSPFFAEQTLSTGDPSNPNLRIFESSQVYVAFEQADQIWIVEGPQFGEEPAITLTTGLPQRLPSISISLSGSLAVYFEQDDPIGIGTGVFQRTSIAGNFNPPMEISPSSDPDLRPRLASSIRFGSSDLVWTREVGGTSLVYYQSGPSGTAEVIDEGVTPDLGFLDNDHLEVVYVRSGSLYHRTGLNGIWSGETSISGTLTPENPRVIPDATGAVHVIFMAGGQVWYVRRPNGGGFSAPVEVTPGIFDVTEAEIIRGEGTDVQVYFTSQGDIWRRSGAGGFFGSIENVTQTPGTVEDRFAAGLDELGTAHIVYRRDGLLRYRNEYPPPDATIAVTNAVGQIPLTVQFEDATEEPVESRVWDLGDGTTSTLANPSHTYTVPGVYPVTLSVVGPGGEDTTTNTSAVVVFEAENVLRVPALDVIQGQPNVTIPVLATHADPLAAYQIGMRWDPTIFSFVDANTMGTPIETMSPDFLVINPLPGPNGVEGVTMGVVIDTVPPFEDITIPPGVDQRLLHIVVNVSGTAPVGSVIPFPFDSTIGNPPVINVFTIRGVSEIPFLIDGQITIVPLSFPPPTIFLRGDVDNDFAIAINDAVFLLNFLFGGGQTPFCIDAADVNDNGSVDLSDPITLLSFLFLFGTPPPYPWPTHGFDPTDDPLGDC